MIWSQYRQTRLQAASRLFTTMRKLHSNANFFFLIPTRNRNVDFLHIVLLSNTNRRTVLEPAGALAVAGLKKYVEEHNLEGKTLVAITSGANMDFNRLRVSNKRKTLSH